MSDAIKKRVQDAIAKYIERQNPQPSKEKRVNGKPEKKVEEEILAWARSRNWFINVYEAKGVYNPVTARYINGRVLSGTPDLLGIMPSGIFAAIELKAKGCRSNLSEKQRIFLLNVIAHNGFACVTDSINHLNKLYTDWMQAENKKDILIRDLPKERVKEDSGFLFNGDDE